MSSLSVRRIRDDVYERLRARAARHGVSMEEEVRRILERAVAAPERLGVFAVKCFGAAHGVELELPRRERRAPVEFAAAPESEK